MDALAHPNVAALLRHFDALHEMVMKSALQRDKLSIENAKLKEAMHRHHQEIARLGAIIEDKNVELRECYASKAKAADDSILKLNNITQELAASTQLRAVQVDHDRVVSINKTVSRELIVQCSENELLLKQKKLTSHDLSIAKSHVATFNELVRRNTVLEDDNCRLRRTASEGAMTRFTKGSDAKKRKR